MPDFVPEDLAAWSKGVWTKVPGQRVTSVSHDTRTLTEGALYVALPGARVDGHELIPEAVKNGAAAVLCDEKRAVPGIPCLEVEDTALALQQIAQGHRRRCAGKIIGITGSAGKTTAKDFLRAMCAAAGPTCATPGNWNNFVGLPLSVLRMEPTDRFGVFEMGMNQAGEIAALAAILEPEFACITSIGEAHLEQLGSVAAIAREKTSLFACLPKEGLSVIDADSDWRELMVSQSSSRTVTCSLYEDADFVGHVVPEQPDLLRVEDRVRGEIWQVPVPLPGKHMRKNILQTAILARACGVSPQEMAAGLKDYEGSSMRWERTRTGTIEVINDAYNANPLSVKCAVSAFAEDAGQLPAWVVLGEMSELGAESHSLHRALGETLDRLDLQGVITVGEAGKWIAEGFTRVRAHAVSDVAAAVEAVEKLVPAGAVLFVKASRSVGLEKLVDELKKRENL